MVRTYLVRVRCGHEEDRSMSRDLPGTAGMHLTEEEIGHDRCGPEKGIVLPIRHWIELFGRGRRCGALSRSVDILSFRVRHPEGTIPKQWRGGEEMRQAVDSCLAPEFLSTEAWGSSWWGERSSVRTWESSAQAIFLAVAGFGRRGAQVGPPLRCTKKTLRVREMRLEL